VGEATLRRVTHLVADGAPVDWDDVMARADVAAHGPLRQLRLLSAVARSVFGARATEPTEGMDRLAAWLQPVLWCAALKCVLAVVGYVAGRTALAREAIPVEMSLVNVLAFGGTAAVLLYGGARDRRAIHLGGFFLLVASSFADRPLRGLPMPGLVTALRALPVEAFVGAYLWLFVWRFPEVSAFSRAQRTARTMALVAAGVGALLLGANLVLATTGPGGPLSLALAFFDRRADAVGGYWLTLLVVATPAVAFAIWKSRQARSDERRRATLFVCGIGIGLAPIVLASFLGLPFSPLRDFLYEQRWPVGIVLYLFLLTIPVTTASAVLVHHVLDVRALARRVLHYALARSIIGLAVAAPFVLLVRRIYIHRHETVAQVLFSRASLALAATGVLMWALARKRGLLLFLLDRAFLLEREDPRTQLARLGEGLRAGSLREICACLADEVRAALNPDPVEVLLRSGGAFRPWVAGSRPLVGDTALASLLLCASDPVSIDLERSRGVERLLPEGERLWLADGAFRLLVPIAASDGRLLGIIALGERRNQMAYSMEDGLLLRAMAAAAAVAITPHLESARAGSQEASGLVDQPADECRRCHSVMPAGSARCLACGGAVTNAALPHVVAGKLRVERRLGAGGMGVVYRALDLTLGRRVAVKTLPRVSAVNSVRMRREARAMAAVTHPNLALIYGAETWRGTPILVVELMTDGTLAERLAGGPLAPPEAVALATVVAEVLERLHAAHILHRDVKPSNIGFLHGNPKLLDFGLAQLTHESVIGLPAGAAGAASDPTDVDAPTVTRLDHLSRHRLVGTPLYMPPEAMAGTPPDPSLDLWALAMVLYEAVAGVHPLRGDDVHETFRRIRDGHVPDIRTHQPFCPAGLAEFLTRALSRDRHRRPSTAAAFRSSLSGAA
jgi:hypothetical protein